MLGSILINHSHVHGHLDKQILSSRKTDIQLSQAHLRELCTETATRQLTCRAAAGPYARIANPSQDSPYHERQSGKINHTMTMHKF